MIIGVGLLGGLFAFVMLMIVGAIFNIDDAAGMILYSTITLSIVISSCSAWIVHTVRDSKGSKGV